MRKVMLAVAALVLVVATQGTAFGQTVAWVDQFGTDRFDFTWGVIASASDVHVSGFTEGTLPGQTSAGGVDAFVRHLDASGNEIWEVQFGTAKGDSGFQVAMDPSGLYVVGVTNGTFPGEAKAGRSDVFLAKFNFAGNQLWVVQFGTTEDDFPSNVVADATGVYVVGDTSGTFPGETPRGENDVFLTRFTADGEQDWTTQFGSRGHDVGYANAIGPAGIYVNGFTWGRLPGQRAHGGADAFVGLFGTDGSRSWLRQFGTRRADFGFGITADATDVYVSGETAGAFKGQRDRKGRDGYVRKFAPDGAALWTRQFGTGADEGCLAAALVGTDVACVGYTYGTLRGQASAGGRDVFVRALDAATGEGTWSLQLGGRGNDDAGWATGVGDTLYIVGGAERAFPGETAFGRGDGFVTRIDVPTT